MLETYTELTAVLAKLGVGGIDSIPNPIRERAIRHAISGTRCSCACLSLTFISLPPRPFWRVFLWEGRR